MKKYTVTMKHKESVFALPVLARDSKVAQNKAVRRAKSMLKDKTITAQNVVNVDYEGFYLNRRFFSVK